METNPYRALMRIFFQFQASTLLYIEDNNISGIIEKKTIEELMSDLSHARLNTEIPIKKLTSSNESIEILLKHGIIFEDQQVIPVIDRNLKFIGLWGKSDILKCLSVFETTARESIDSSDNADHHETPKENNFSLHPRPEVKISINTIIDPQASEIITEIPPLTTKQNEHPINENLQQQDFVSIKTLEALPIPMVALDTKGEILFYNKDWIKLQKEFRELLGVKSLMRVSRDLMAKMAFEGDLQIDSILILPDSPKGYQVKMKSILDDQKIQSRVFGYIFWAEEKLSSEGIVQNEKKPERGHENENLKTEISDKVISESGRQYSGKTLIELLQDEEKRIMHWAMHETGQNQSNAAMLLGIPRQTFSYRYRKLFLKTKKKRP